MACNNTKCKWYAQCELNNCLTEGVDYPVFTSSVYDWDDYA